MNSPGKISLASARTQKFAVKLSNELSRNITMLNAKSINEVDLENSERKELKV